MTANFSSTNFEFGQSSDNQQPPKPRYETPLRVCVLGNFSKRTGCETPEPLHQQKPIEISCDNFDSVLKRVHPSLEFCIDGIATKKIQLQFATLEEFHPDKLLKQPAIGSLLQLLKQDISESMHPPSVAPKIQVQQSTESESDAETLVRLLGTPQRDSTERETVNKMLKEIVAPHVVPHAGPQQQELVTKIDHATAALLRKILHHPLFQELEAAWRSLDFLVRHLDVAGDIKIYLFDVSKEKLAEDFYSSQTQEQSALYQIFVEEDSRQSQSAGNWGFVVGLYNFAYTQTDLILLKNISGICATAQAALLAGADYETFDALANSDTNSTIEDNNAKLWNDFRKSPASSYVGLCLPRFLLRLPYGPTTDPIEHFAFEEMAGEPNLLNYLWGSPAILCACLLGLSFNDNGWNFIPGDIAEIDGLPLHVYKEEGELKMTPCAEHWIAESTMDKFLNLGLIPLLSVRGRDAIHIARFQSVHTPPTTLTGRWSMS